MAYFEGIGDGLVDSWWDGRVLSGVYLALNASSEWLLRDPNDGTLPVGSIWSGPSRRRSRCSRHTMNPLKETKTMSKPNSIQTSIVKSEHVPIILSKGPTRGTSRVPEQ